MAPKTQYKEEFLSDLQLLGYAKGLIDSDSSLTSLYQQAVKNKWTAERFAASIPGTTWYKNRNAAQRYAEVLKNQDPTEYARILQTWTDWVKDQAVAMGATIDENQAADMASKITSGGMSAAQASKVISSTFINYQDADLVGRAGALQDSITRYNQQFGNVLSQGQIGNLVQQSITGTIADSDVLDQIRRAAASTYSNFSDRILNGETVQDIADPYFKIVENYLELPGVGLDEKLIMDALTGKNDKGGMKYSSLGDFVKAVKSDERWQYTGNARAEYSNLGKKFLTDWGLIG